ncbi:hypothetical protein EEB19_09850 [Gordonia sp. OPL2]|nr:hypothetical protein EEB19_09850 [Gordonia sp. OPL2]
MVENDLVQLRVARAPIAEIAAPDDLLDSDDVPAEDAEPEVALPAACTGVRLEPVVTQNVVDGLVDAVVVFVGDTWRCRLVIIVEELDRRLLTWTIAIGLRGAGDVRRARIRVVRVRLLHRWAQNSRGRVLVIPAGLVTLRCGRCRGARRGVEVRLIHRGRGGFRRERHRRVISVRPRTTIRLVVVAGSPAVTTICTVTILAARSGRVRCDLVRSAVLLRPGPTVGRVVAVGLVPRVAVARVVVAQPTA